MCFGCSIEPSHWDGSFEYTQHMFRLRNKHSYLENCILIRDRILGLFPCMWIAYISCKVYIFSQLMSKLNKSGAFNIHTITQTLNHLHSEWSNIQRVLAILSTSTDLYQYCSLDHHAHLRRCISPQYAKTKMCIYLVALRLNEKLHHNI